MATPRRFLTALFLTLFPFSTTPLLHEKSFLLFGMLTVDRNVSSCTHLAARFEYISSGGSFHTMLDGVEAEGGVGEVTGRLDVMDIAGTLVCPERASSSSSASYLITIPTSGPHLQAASHGLVKLYGVQLAKDGSESELGGYDGDVMPVPSLAARQYVLVSTSDKRVNVDIDMTAEGVRVDLFPRAFSTSMDGMECRSIMRRAFGGMPEVIRWAGAWDGPEAEDSWNDVGRCAPKSDNEHACCLRRPTIACAGIGVGAVLVAWMVLTRRSPGGGVADDPPQSRRAAGTERLVREKGSPKDVSTPDKTTDVREWKREGDRLRRDIKRQSADLKKT